MCFSSLEHELLLLDFTESVASCNEAILDSAEAPGIIRLGRQMAVVGLKYPNLGTPKTRCLLLIKLRGRVGVLMVSIEG